MGVSAPRPSASRSKAPPGLPLERLAEPQRAGHELAGAAGDDIRALLRERALVRAGGTASELLGDCETEHAVAEELQSLVGLDALLDPRRMGERAPAQLIGEPLDERCERGHVRR